MRKHPDSQSQSGQTMLLVLIITLILFLAVYFIFDIQQTLGLKIKSRNAVDAAALAGSEWQRHSLNLIGEINLIKATNAIVEDFAADTLSPQYLTLTNPGDPVQLAADQARVALELQRLSEASAALGEMQMRIAFTGPLLGFGAAQQAARNNGLATNNDYGIVASIHLEQLKNDSVYGPDVLDQTLEGYSWRSPYIAMLEQIFQPDQDGSSCSGLAVAVNDRRLGMPILDNDNGLIDINVFRSQFLFDAIHANYWCGVRNLIRQNFGADGTRWWGDIELVQSSANFPAQSEYMPLNIIFSGHESYSDTGLQGADASYTSLLDQSGRKDESELLQNLFDRHDPTSASDSDRKYNPLPYIRWAIYDSSRWYPYGEDTISDWNTYLRDTFKPGFAYRSGAVSRVDSRTQADFITGKWDQSGNNDNQTGERFLGDEFLWAKSANSGENYGRRLRDTERRMKNNSGFGVRSSTLAKAFGRLATTNGFLPPYASDIVLPVFERSTIIPFALPDNPGESMMNNPQLMAFLTEYLPELGNRDSIASMEEWMQDHPRASWFRYYHEALLKLNDPAWRASGIEWLDTPIYSSVVDDSGNITQVQTGVNEDICDYWPGGGNTPRRGPSVLH